MSQIHLREKKPFGGWLKRGGSFEKENTGGKSYHIQNGPIRFSSLPVEPVGKSMMILSGSFSLSSQLNFTQNLRVFLILKTPIGPVIFRLAEN